MAQLTKIFRPIFVLFTLYLMGDAFSRWDGARYYASINEFSQSVALVFVLWTFLAVSLSLLLWITAKTVCLMFKAISIEDVLVFSFCTVIITGLIYFSKGTFRSIEVTANIKILILAVDLLLAVVLSWFLHKKSKSILNSINEHITPLLWLFSLLFAVSIIVVTYKAILPGEPRTPADLINKTDTGHAEKTNIILLTFDAMTARNMSAYGYERQTTPFIEEWSRSASLFSRVEAESNYTTPTTSSLMTGKRVWTHQTYFVEIASDVVKENDENLPFLLKQHGYTNIAIQQIHRASVKKLGIAENFDYVIGPEEQSNTTQAYKIADDLLYRVFGDKIMLYDWILKEDFILFKFINKVSTDSSVTEQQPETAFSNFLKIYDNGLTAPFFAWIHVFAPHDPYLPPEPYKGMFNSSELLRTWKSQKNSRPSNYIDISRDRYDEFIRYADKSFEDFMSELISRGIDKNTVLILSADHGESFAHNYKGHGGPHLFEDMTNIPLIIKVPGQEQGQHFDILLEQIDITPTILELTEIPVPSWMEGRSLLPLVRGKKILQQPAFSMNLTGNQSRGHKIEKGTIAIWDGDYKLIHYLGEDKSLLFNLDNDPDELSNIFDVEQAIGNNLLGKIDQELKAANQRLMKRNR